MSYSRNIARLKETSRANTRQRMQNNIDQATYENAAGQKEAENIATALSGFSKHLHDWKVKDIEKKKQQGKIAARQHETADAEKIAALAEELKITKQEDTRYQEIKAEMLKLGGASVYPDADRVANLSPWQQVGYAKEKLRAFNETFDDKLAHAMQNSEKAITISGVTFTPKELRENNITGLPFKEAAVKVLSEDIREAAQVDRFSPELQSLSGTHEAIIKAQEGQMDKYRERYNIDSSHNTRIKAQKEWATSARSGEDLHRLFLIQSNTVNDKNELLGNTGGWDSVMGILQDEGVKSGDPFYAEKLGSLELPPNLRAQLGAKAGTTFAQQWPGRFTKLKSDIKSGIVSANNAELKFQETAGTALQVEFIEAARKGDLSTAQVNQYKRRFGELGLTIPSSVTNYETATMRDEREDKQQIEYLMASQDGYISNEQLDRFHPKAALEFREKATRMEEKAIKAHDSEAKIKSYLDTAFTNMGIKANEKSPAYVEAMSNAKADYAEKYNRYIAMNYSSAEASRLALHAKEVKDKETGEVIPDSMGVLTEIEQFGEKSKYVIEGQAIEKTMKAGHLRVARVASGKREMLNDPDIIFNGTIGGDYGHRQLTSVKNNIEKYGARKGLRMDKGAMQYYKGLARGRDDNWMGLLDKQLKATGHPGLWEEERPAAVDLLSGENGKGEKLEDPNNLIGLTKSANQAFNYPSVNSYLYGMNQLKEGSNYGRSPISIWDQQRLGFGEKKPEVTDESYLKEIEGILSGRIPPPIGGPTPPPTPHRRDPRIMTGIHNLDPMTFPDRPSGPVSVKTGGY